MMRITLNPSWAVHANTSVTLHASASGVWRVMESFSRFIAADPYHTAVTDPQGNTLDRLPARGTKLRIGHGIGLTLFYREGSMIHVKPGRGFAFTDLSTRGRHVGFPHTYAYTLTPIDEQTCTLSLTVRGNWSARWMPRWLVRAWLGWVMLQASWLMRAHVSAELRATNNKVEKAQQPVTERKAVQP